MTRARWIAIVAASVLMLAIGVGVSFGPYVRRSVEQRAARRGASVVIGSVRPTTHGVILRDLAVSFADAPSVMLHIREVEVDGTPWGGATAVQVRGAGLLARGEVSELVPQLRAVLARGRGDESAGARATPIVASECELEWTSADGSVAARDLGARRGAADWELTVGSADIVRPSTKVSVKELRAGVRKDAGEWHVTGLKAAVVEVAHTTAVPLDAAVASASPSESSRSLIDRIERAKELASRAAGGALLVLAPGAGARVEHLRVELRHLDEVLHLGPDSLQITAAERALEVALTPVAKSGEGTPLLLSASLPASPTEPVSISLQGGPVTIGALGVRDGDLGLLDVDKTTIEAGGNVELSADARHVEMGIHGRVRGLSVENKRLASEPVRGLDVGFAVNGGADLDGSMLRVDRGDIDIGTVHAETKGEIARGKDGATVRGTFAIPLAACQGLVDALPPGLAPTLVGVKAGGTFALRGQIAFDSRRPAETLVELTLINECRITSAPPAINVAHFRAPFRRKVYTPDGQRVEIESGPGTPGWVPYGGISRFMEAAVMTTEDGGFRRHRGFDLEAIRNSIRENLKEGRFVRGASTISMQTAKNVYLEREKTLARKLQEAFLTSYLEQELTKEQILELYLNSIEFGPMIYGIGPAAAHYFHTSAAELSLGQALYLSSILPNPKVQHFGEGGRVSPSWMGYLHKLMRMMVKRHLIEDTDLAEGLGEWVVFGQPKPMRIHGDDTGIGVEGAPPDDAQP